MSPFELMDWIGIRTAFDAGRVFWQSFPGRFEPSPIPPALIKAQRIGRHCGRGFYDYQDGKRSIDLSPATKAICARYRGGESEQLSDDDVMLLLSIPMWIEAAYAYRDRVATSHQQFDVAMRGGLGYRSKGSWLEFFDALGSGRIAEIIEHYWPTRKSLRAPAELLAGLPHHGPTECLDQFAVIQ